MSVRDRWKGPEFPGDQREDDGRSLTWDGPPLDERTEILGAPVVELDLEVDRPSAFVAVRLCDVRPDGASTRVSFGVLNLTHRDGHATARPMLPGERVAVRVQLNDTGYAFLPGHRLRLAVSTQYWPMVWPSPEPVLLTVHGGRLELPVRPPRTVDADLRDLGEPTWGPEAAVTVLRPGLGTRDRHRRDDGHDHRDQHGRGPAEPAGRERPRARGDRVRPDHDRRRRPGRDHRREPARVRDRSRRVDDPGVGRRPARVHAG